MKGGDHISDGKKKQILGLQKQLKKNNLLMEKWKQLWIKYHQKSKS